MELKNKKEYAAPTAEAMDVRMNGVLCASTFVMFYDATTPTPDPGGLGRNNYGVDSWE